MRPSYLQLLPAALLTFGTAGCSPAPASEADVAIPFETLRGAASRDAMLVLVSHEHPHVRRYRWSDPQHPAAVMEDAQPQAWNTLWTDSALYLQSTHDRVPYLVQIDAASMAEMRRAPLPWSALGVRSGCGAAFAAPYQVRPGTFGIARAQQDAAWRFSGEAAEPGNVVHNAPGAPVLRRNGHLYFTDWNTELWRVSCASGAAERLLRLVPEHVSSGYFARGIAFVHDTTLVALFGREHRGPSVVASCSLLSRTCAHHVLTERRAVFDAEDDDHVIIADALDDTRTRFRRVRRAELAGALTQRAHPQRTAGS